MCPKYWLRWSATFKEICIGVLKYLWCYFVTTTSYMNDCTNQFTSGPFFNDGTEGAETSPVAWPPGQQRGNRRPGAKWSSRASPPPTFTLWPMRQKEFHSGLRPLRHFEEFLGIRPLQSEVPQSTRPWGNLPPLSSSLWAILAPPTRHHCFLQYNNVIKIYNCET